MVHMRIHGLRFTFRMALGVIWPASALYWSFCMVGGCPQEGTLRQAAARGAPASISGLKLQLPLF